MRRRQTAQPAGGAVVGYLIGTVDEEVTCPVRQTGTEFQFLYGGDRRIERSSLGSSSTPNNYRPNTGSNGTRPTNTTRYQLYKNNDDKDTYGLVKGNNIHGMKGGSPPPIGAGCPLDRGPRQPNHNDHD